MKFRKPFGNVYPLGTVPSRIKTLNAFVAVDGGINVDAVLEDDVAGLSAERSASELCGRGRLGLCLL